MTNVNAPESTPDKPDGFVVGPRARSNGPARSSTQLMFYPYDDFTIAAIMQLEQIGFCAPARAQFVLETDISHQHCRSTRGGCSMVRWLHRRLRELVEAVTQMFGEAGRGRSPSRRTR